MPVGRANHLLGEVDAANARLRELARQQQRPRAGAGAHLERALGRGLHVEEGRGQRSEVLHRARAGAPVPAGRGAIEEAPHRAANRRPGPGRAHDQPVQHAAGDADPPGRRSSLGGRHQATAREVVRGSHPLRDILPCRVVRRPSPLACAADAAEDTPRALAPAVLAALAALLLAACGGEDGRRVDLGEPSRGLPGGAGAAPQAGRPEAAAAKGRPQARAWWPPSTRAAAASRSRSTPGTRRRR